MAIKNDPFNFEFTVKSYNIYTNGHNIEIETSTGMNADAKIYFIIHLHDGNEFDKSLNLAFSQTYDVGRVFTISETRCDCEFPLDNFLPTIEALKALKGVEIKVKVTSDENGKATYQFEGLITQ